MNSGYQKGVTQECVSISFEPSGKDKGDDQLTKRARFVHCYYNYYYYYYYHTNTFTIFRRNLN
jgi:hypothetical protein